MNINRFFEHTLGATLKNPRWSWGAVEKTGNRVFLRVWEDQITRDGDGQKVQVYWNRHRTGSPGYSERLEHLDEIKRGAQGIGVITRAVDPNTDGAREIRSFDQDVLVTLGDFSEDPDGIYARITGRVPVSKVARARDLT